MDISPELLRQKAEWVSRRDVLDDKVDVEKEPEEWPKTPEAYCSKFLADCIEHISRTALKISEAGGMRVDFRQTMIGSGDKLDLNVRLFGELHKHFRELGFEVAGWTTDNSEESESRRGNGDYSPTQSTRTLTVSWAEVTPS